MRRFSIRHVLSGVSRHLPKLKGHTHLPLPMPIVETKLLDSEVYIVKSNQSSENYNNWLCGGALISSRQVLTSATCLTEMTHVYVIAGYRKYVNGRGIELDECTRTRKNRVVKTCVPKGFNMSYNDQSKWMAIDIGVAIVENPYDFSDQTWKRHCSYIPKPIRICYDERSQRPKTDVVAFGWGGTYWRDNTDILDHNAVYLQEIASTIVLKKRCKDSFDGENVKRVIQKYMICVEGQGNLDGGGLMQDLGPHTRQGCRRSGNGSGCRFDTDSIRKSRIIANPVPSRRQSLCQNDHGGPLVTWTGSEEVLIGVACTSIVDANTLICKSPSVFTGTFCTGKVVECLTAMSSRSLRKCSEKMWADGINIHENHVDWENTVLKTNEDIK